MFDGVKFGSGGSMMQAQERGYHVNNAANQLLGGFDPVGLLAGLSFIAFLLHALLSFLFRPSAAAAYYLPHASAASARSGQEPPAAAEGLLQSAMQFYENLNENVSRPGSINRH